MRQIDLLALVGNLYDDWSSDGGDPLLTPGSETNIEPSSKRVADTPGDDLGDDPLLVNAALSALADAVLKLVSSVPKRPHCRGNDVEAYAIMHPFCDERHNHEALYPMATMTKGHNPKDIPWRTVMGTGQEAGAREAYENGSKKGPPRQWVC